MTDELTNAQRAFWGMFALQQTPHNENPERDLRLTDLLTNLMHAADKLDVDFSYCYFNARRHYLAERNED